MPLRLLLATWLLTAPSTALPSWPAPLTTLWSAPAPPAALLLITLITSPLSSPLPPCTLQLRVLHPTLPPLLPRWRDLPPILTPSHHFLYPLPPPTHAAPRYQAILTCPPTPPPTPPPCVWPPHGHFFTPPNPPSPLTLPLAYFVFPSSLPCVDPRAPMVMDGVCPVGGDRGERGRGVAGNSSAVGWGSGVVVQPVCEVRGMRKGGGRPRRGGGGVEGGERKGGERERGRARCWLAGLSVLMLSHSVGLMWTIARWTAKVERW